jgi:hypothetical protein
MWLWDRTDTRLLGTWRSDLERTVAELSARPDFPDPSKAKLASLFGKLELRYTRRYCYSRYEEVVSRRRYRVLASDAASVAILAEAAIHHIHFDGDSYWMTLGASNVREFFRRVG